MTNASPQFLLSSVYEDGTESEPEIYPLTEVPVHTKATRRGLLGLALVMGSGLSACAVAPPPAPSAPAQRHRRGRVAYTVNDKVTGQSTRFTQPCGSPVPVGAVCTCNCIGAPVRTKPITRTWCSCNKVCVCVPVYH